MMGAGLIYGFKDFIHLNRDVEAFREFLFEKITHDKIVKIHPETYWMVLE